MKKALFYAAYCLAPAIPAALYVRSLGNGFSSYTVSVILGVFAFSFIAGQFLLASRPGWATRALGTKGLLAFHGIMAVVAIALAALHKILKEANGFSDEAFQARFGAIGWWIFAVVIVLAALVMANTFLQKFEPLKRLKAWVYERTPLNYKRARVLHNLAAVAGALVLVHVLLASTSTLAANPVGVALLAAWMLFCLGAYLTYRIKGRAAAKA